MEQPGREFLLLVLMIMMMNTSEHLFLLVQFVLSIFFLFL